MSIYYSGKNIEQHYGSRESKTTEELDFDARERAARMEEYNSKNVEQHYGSRESADDSTNEINMANNKERLEGAESAKSFLDNILETATIEDPEQFSEAVLKSLEVKEVMRHFTDGLFEKMREKAHELNNIYENDTDKTRKEIEQYGAIYLRYMYKLNDSGYGFNDEHSLEIPEDIIEKLYNNQKNTNEFFKMSLDVRDKDGNEKTVHLNMISIIRDMSLGIRGPNKSPKVNIGRHILKQEVIDKMNEYKAKSKELNELQKDEQQKGDNGYVK